MERTTDEKALSVVCRECGVQPGAACLSGSGKRARFTHTQRHRDVLLFHPVLVAKLREHVEIVWESMRGPRSPCKPKEKQIAGATYYIAYPNRPFSIVFRNRPHPEFAFVWLLEDGAEFPKGLVSQ